METLKVRRTMSDCGICCETYNRKNHTKVQCPFCDFNCCRECTQKYLLSTINDPHCMSCKNAWNREFVDTACTKVFRNKELKAHRETILVEREKCLLPQTQELVARKKQELATIRLLADARKEMERQRRLQWELENQLNALRAGHPVEQGEGRKQTFVRKCPLENCKGFLSSQWKCGLCESKICSKCNELNEGEEHVCDPNNVETVALLAKDTKPCPTCGTMIFKISGCNQMWCPDCHTAFDWRSGRVETGVIHNPHFYEFQRRTGGGAANRNLGDIPCGGAPNIAEINGFFHPGARPLYGYRYAQNRLTPSHPDENDLMNLHRCMIHATNYELPQYTYREPDNSDLRVSYLMDNLSEEHWKKTLQQREKSREKKRDISNILRMFCDTSGDIFRQMIVRDISIEQCKDTIDRLVTYFNETMVVIHGRYNCVTPYINQQYTMYSKSYKGDDR